MISTIYRNERFNATDLPLLDDTWRVLDEIEESGDAQVVAEVLSGARYRRRVSALGLRGLRAEEPDYLLQVLMQIPHDKYEGDLSIWSQHANDVMERISVAHADSADAVVTALAGVEFPEQGGAFGTARHEDSVARVYQPYYFAEARDPVRSRIVMSRAAIVLNESTVFRDMLPRVYCDSHVRDARSGHVVIT